MEDSFTSHLFAELEIPAKAEDKKGIDAPARVKQPNRHQMELRPSNLESLLPEGHRARFVWGYVERQDWSKFYVKIKAREGQSGRPAIAPEILFALWLYGTLDNVGSAREIERLTQSHDAYRWICGGVPVNYHSLSDFRVEHAEELDELLTENLASLMSIGVVKLKTVAQDGVRVRASAGAASFRREASLKNQLEQARAHIQRLKQQIHNDPGQGERQKQAAQQRAAKEREARIEAALKRLPELQEIKKRQGKRGEDARASTTDAQASVMKMGDGGFRPAYNTQYATDCESQIIVGVEVTTAGHDMHALSPMVEQVETRCGKTPEQWLVDGGYPKHEQLEAVAEKTTVYAPVPQPPSSNKKAEQNKTDDDPKGGNASISHSSAEETTSKENSSVVATWRTRMNTDQAKEIYKQRAATAECVNAQARNRGLTRFNVRGLRNVRCVATLFALAHNLSRMITLAPNLVGLGTHTSCFVASG